ncbi:MAG TPA: bifunctional serine/threonine-protein kinase/formylglycine-generating enzyme family protein [Chlamydiales bacterium]|nr:bifunctional serine/threonine-protein kinase/formylglycine-generating enzyme family protein [Chlamydiales bacterium]
MSEEIFGDYTLIKKIGQSGFSEVFLAKHRFMNRKVVLKVIAKQLTENDQFIEQFSKDVAVLSTLDHPSIPKVRGLFSFEGRYFIVYDALDDNTMTLENYLKVKGKILLENEVEAILRQVASALDYVHSKTMDGLPVIHRSIKPSNVLVNESEKGLQVYLVDFALTRLIKINDVIKNHYRHFVLSKKEEQIFPLISFLAPEQKSNDPVTVATDSYSFGILAYYLITSAVPEGCFDLPSKIAVEYKLNWDLIICKCLQSEPEKRPIRLIESLNTYLSNSSDNIHSIDILSWEEVGKKVENAMQMSFEFSPDEELSESSTMVTFSSDEEDLPELKDSENEDVQEHKPILKPQKLIRPTYEPDPGAIFQKELNVSVYQPKTVEVREVKPLLTEMAVIQGGTFMRGSQNGGRDEMPVHQIHLNTFALDVHPVTNEQFVRFLESMGGEKDADNNDIIRLRNSRIKRKGGKLIIESGYIKHPVVGVTWYGSLAYAKWVGKRLPTEAEWEIAAMSLENEALYPTGSDIDHSKANFFNSDTTAVMSYPANEQGLYDMAGNVYEWCNDWYAYNYYDTAKQEPDNPQGPPQGVYRVLRGGCWKSLKEDMRFAHRHRNNPGAVMGTYGFRCAADVT